MSSFMPFALQEKGRGFLAWSIDLNPSWGGTCKNAAINYYANWGDSGRVFLQQINSNFHGAWVQRLEPRENSQPIKIYPVDGNVVLCYVLSGSLVLKCRLGKCSLLSGAWQLLPGDLSEIEMEVNRAARLLWITIPLPELNSYRLTFPDVVDWLASPTFFTWYEQQGERSSLQRLMTSAVDAISKQGVSIGSSDEIWQLTDRILVCAMGELSRHLYVVGSEAATLPNRLMAAAIIRTELLSDIHRTMPRPLHQLSRMVGCCESSLQRSFKMLYGTSMIKYFLTAKMEAVARQIINTKMELQDIGLDNNYGDYSSFSGAVNKWWGASPRAIRKNGGLPVRAQQLNAPKYLLV